MLQRGRQRDDAAIHVADALARMLGLASGTKQLENLARREELMRRLVGPRRGMRIPLTAAPVTHLPGVFLDSRSISRLRMSCSVQRPHCAVYARLRLYTMPISAHCTDTERLHKPQDVTFQGALSRRHRQRRGQRVKPDGTCRGLFATAYETLTALRELVVDGQLYVDARTGFADCTPTVMPGCAEHYAALITWKHHPTTQRWCADGAVQTVPLTGHIPSLAQQRRHVPTG